MYKFLLAVSGGPDSMFLLNKYKNKNILVAHINYNLRNNSSTDQKIVEDFCFKNNLKLKILSINEKPQKNLQNWARNIRYDFFASLMKKYQIKKLIIAHHKDDFLETCLMQKNSLRNPDFWGIKKNNLINNINIYRPLVNKLWKDQIEKKVINKKIDFAIDQTNFTDKYTRNKIRNNLKKMSINEKQKQLNWFLKENKKLKKQNKLIDKQYQEWKKQNFKTDFLKNNFYDEKLIFKLINDNFYNIKLSKNKIQGIKDFFLSKEGKKFKLNNNNFLIKKQGYISFNKI